MEQELKDMIVELTTRVDNMENVTNGLADNILKLEQILDAIAKQVIPDEDTND